MNDKLTCTGLSWKTRALDAEELLDSALCFIQSKGLYEEYFKFKETKRKRVT